MRTALQAERMAKAVQAIEDETTRLGGRLEMPSVRAPDAATKHILILEAVAVALAGIEVPEVTAPKTSAPRRKGVTT